MVDSQPMSDPEGRQEPSIGHAPPGDFVSLFLADQRRLHRYIVTLLGRQQDAEDLLQETAAILWRKFGDFQPGTSFYAWACRAAYLNVLEYRRQRRRDATLLDADVLEKLALFYAAEEGTFEEFQIEALEKCLEKLIAKDRQLVERCYTTTGIRAKQVAEELNRPADSVYRSLGRIRKSLLECLRRAAAAQENGKGGDR
jgi:RNA polymerase sigma-70 factor (ECF subfamily)